jgi:hypothetical protein
MKEEWKTGKMEEWIVEKFGPLLPFHYSIVPIFHHSILF